MTTITLRSTSNLTEYVRITDRLATYAHLIEQLQRRERELRPIVLGEIGDRRAVTVRGQVRILEPGETSSIKRTCDDETAVAFCQSHGLATHQRTPDYVAPAAFTSYVKKGLIAPELYSIETTPVVIVH